MASQFSSLYFPLTTTPFTSLPQHIPSITDYYCLIRTLSMSFYINNALVLLGLTLSLVFYVDAYL